jgi:ribonuclease Z
MRIMTLAASVLFALTAGAFFLVPDDAARAFGLAAIDAAGLASLRADLGGLFAGLALVCTVAARTGLRSWFAAGAMFLGAIVSGRILTWIINAGPSGDVASLVIELAVLAILINGMRGSKPSAMRISWRRPAMVAASLVVIGVIGFAGMSSPAVAQRIYDRASLERAGNTNVAPMADDALRVAVCGSSAPLPSPDRAKACVAVFAGGKFYVVDVGPESVENLVLWGIPLSQIGGVMLTHFHSDHIGDLGELNLQTWAAGRPAPLNVYGGPGIESVVDGFNAAYTLDQGYRTLHHGTKVMDPNTWPMIPRTVPLIGAETLAKDRIGLVFEDGGLRVTAIEVDHTPIAPAYAYRFDYRGRSVLVTGDLKMHTPLIEAATDVDVMVSEAISFAMTRSIGDGARAGGRDRAAAIMHDIEDYHIRPEQAAAIANAANVKLLVFYHLLPAPDGWLPRRLFAQGISEARRGDWTLADDGSVYTLPIGSTAIQRGSMIE